MIKVAIGQDSHRIQDPSTGRPLILGGIRFEADYCLMGNSDADVVLHAVTNAISGITGIPILGKKTDELCAHGITDSHAYLTLALKDFSAAGFSVSHLSVSIECKRPKVSPLQNSMRKHLAECLETNLSNVAITATSGERLTEFGKGNGIQVLAILTASRIHV